MERVVIAGAGLAGLRTAEGLRTNGYAGRLTMVGAEPHPPYDRPPLSKAVLAGDADDTSFDMDLECELLPGRRVTGIPRDGVVDTTEGPLDFDGLVIATGAAPMRLPGPGPQHVLRTIEDARALRSALRPGARVVIVGAGWIGAEVATAAARAECRVTVVEAGEAPLAAAIGPEVGAATARWYAAAGVELRYGVKAGSVEADGLALADGGLLPADVVVTGIGVRPELGWLAGTDLPVADGVVVDERLRAADGIVAVGDCAAWWSRRYGKRLRVEHWDVALSAPDVAAVTLLGGDAVYDPVPYFWSEQFGKMVQYAGHHTAADRLVWRGDPAADRWSVCWLAGETMVAVLTVNYPRDLVQGRRAIAAAAPVDADRLADASVAIKDLAGN